MVPTRELFNGLPSLWFFHEGKLVCQPALEQREVVIADLEYAVVLEDPAKVFDVAAGKLAIECVMRNGQFGLSKACEDATDFRRTHPG